MSLWQVFVKLTHGKSIAIDFTQPEEEIRVSDLKEKIKEKTGLNYEFLSLMYAGKQLEDKKLLKNYPGFEKEVTIFLLGRGIGGSTQEQYDKKTKLPVTDTECMICQTSPSLLMPCTPEKHVSMCSMCVPEFARNAIESKKTTISCTCGTEWDLNVIKEYGRVSDEDVQHLAEGLSQNVIDTDPKIQTCPNCRYYLQRKDESVPKIRCNNCEVEGNPNKDFCWFCRQPWTARSSNYCANPKCDASGGLLGLIQEAPMKTISGTTCPSKRLCPHCGLAIEHIEGCRRMPCPFCKGVFCFICLQKGSNCNNCKLAPIQTKALNN